MVKKRSFSPKIHAKRGLLKNHTSLAKTGMLICTSRWDTHPHLTPLKQDFPLNLDKNFYLCRE
jgi:hypothetical protein